VLTGDTIASCSIVRGTAGV